VPAKSQICLAFTLVCIWLFDSTLRASDQPTNLVANSSFELGLGQGLPSHWADILNDLTIRLSAHGQPLPPPTIVEDESAPHGRYTARLEVAKDQPHHLTSAVMPIEGARAYVLSAYARSTVPRARLRLSLWTRPLDWQSKPDAQGPAIALTDQWKRHEFHFIVGYRAGPGAEIGVVDLVAEADQPGHVWIDAVQLEAGSLISEFQPRHQVEAILSSRGKPHRGMVHRFDEPVTIDLKLYNNTNEMIPSDLELAFSDEDGNVIKTEPVLNPIPPGLSNRRIETDLGLVGQYRANCRVRGGAGVDVADHLFLLRPVLARDEQAIGCSIDGRFHKLPAGRVDVPWENAREWYAEPAQQLVVNDDHTIFLFACDGIILRTSDGGLSWDQVYESGSGFAAKPGTASEINEAGDDVNTIRGPCANMSVMRDGSFLCVALDNERHVGMVNRSRDRGRTWETICEIPDLHKYGAGPIAELADGTYVWVVGIPARGFVHSVFAFRSTDEGNTWTRYPVAPGGEPFVHQLSTGRLLCTVRFNVAPPRERFDLYLANKWNWLYWQRANSGSHISSYSKNLVLLDSDDGGINWKNSREVTQRLGTMHGMTVELPDGRIALIHCERAPPTFGGERARISRDGGNTWQPERYYLHTTGAYPGYSASCVLPPELADGKPGMLLTVVGDRSEGNWAGEKPAGHTPPRMQVVRWRPLSR
jgi:hypothetical protein